MTKAIASTNHIVAQRSRTNARTSTYLCEVTLRCITLKDCPLIRQIILPQLRRRNAQVARAKSARHWERSFSTNEAPRSDTLALGSRTEHGLRNIAVATLHIVASYLQTRVKGTARTVLGIIDGFAHRAWSILHLGPEFSAPKIAERARSVKKRQHEQKLRV